MQGRRVLESLVGKRYSLHSYLGIRERAFRLMTEPSLSEESDETLESRARNARSR